MPDLRLQASSSEHRRGGRGLQVVGDFLVARTDKVRIISLKTGNTVFTVPDKITPLPQIKILADRDRIVLSGIFEEVTKDRMTTGVWRLSDGKRLGYLSKTSDRNSIWVEGVAGDGEIVVAETTPDGEIFFEVWNISSDTPRFVREKLITKHTPSSTSPTRSAIAGAAFYHLHTLIYTPNVLAVFTGTAPRAPLLVRSSDFEVLEKAGQNERSGLLSFGEHPFVYFARSDGNLALWSGQSGSLIILPKVQLGSEDKLVIDPTGSTLLITRPSSTLEVWNVPARTKQATIEGSRIKESFYTSEGTAITTVQEGGTVRLWSLSGDSLGTIGGVSGANVIVRRKDCRVVVWTTEGQVLTFVSGWQILGILFFPHRECV